ncbi:MAG: hypothetical protein QOI57_2129, partial [Rubrobacteraceae bacterium]|nr:hypothetical protein [Rubrobacteraceae bacterium]
MSEQGRAARGREEPEPGRPGMVEGYGISTSSEGMLSWDRVGERMEGSR